MCCAVRSSGSHFKRDCGAAQTHRCSVRREPRFRMTPPPAVAQVARSPREIFVDHDFKRTVSSGDANVGRDRAASASSTRILGDIPRRRLSDVARGSRRMDSARKGRCRRRSSTEHPRRRRGGPEVATRLVRLLVQWRRHRTTRAIRPPSQGSNYRSARRSRFRPHGKRRCLGGHQLARTSPSVLIH